MRTPRVLLVAALLALVPGPARAYFERTDAGARTLALGPSGMAMVADVSAYHWNPAALVLLTRHELLIDYSKPYGVPDLQENTLAVGGRRGNSALALAWHHMGVADVYGEDQFVLAAARTLWSGRAGEFDAGAALKLGRAAFRPFTVVGEGVRDFGAITRPSFDLGLRWRTPLPVDLAWVRRDAFRPRYEFIAGSGGYRIPARSELAAALRWNRESTISLGWAERVGARAQVSAGMEIAFFDVFAIRAGLLDVAKIYQAQQPPDVAFTGGIGVFHKGVHVDAAAETNHDMGATYRASLRVPFGPGGAR